MKIGDIVKSKEDGTLGTVHYSTFGFSIHCWSDYGETDEMCLGKTVGCTSKEILEHWDIVELPKGYKVHKYGGVVRDE